jgi:iron complex outermembrane recepter protein
MTTTRSSVAAAVAAALYAGAVSAEGGAGADPATAADAGGVSEVIVTATRREASAQDIPLSITAISADSLEQSGIEDIADLAHSMAGVSYTDKGPFGGVNGANLIIRGLNS